MTHHGFVIHLHLRRSRIGQRIAQRPKDTCKLNRTVVRDDDGGVSNSSACSWAFARRPHAQPEILTGREGSMRSSVGHVLTLCSTAILHCVQAW